MANRVPPHLYFVTSAVFHYLGPAFAVLLFARVDVLGVAWLRIASAAADLRALAQAVAGIRPPRPRRQATACGVGGRAGRHERCFYIAIDRLPLGTVAAIEFLPVVGLAAFGARTPRNAGALLLAVAGVYLLTDVQLVAQPLGLAFAFANARAVLALHRPRAPGGPPRAHGRDRRPRGGRC